MLNERSLVVACLLVTIGVAVRKVYLFNGNMDNYTAAVMMVNILYPYWILLQIDIYSCEKIIIMTIISVLLNTWV
jgi:hypothetical protein